MRQTYILLLILAAGLAAAAGGCNQQSPAIVAVKDAPLPADETSPAFIDRVSSMSRVAQNDVMRGVIMFLDGNDACQNFQQRVNKLLERKIVDASWTFDPAKPITRGELAYMMYQALHVPGGIILALTGPNQRYCLREMQYRGFITSGMMWSDVTGGELVAVLARADAYRQTGKMPEILKTSGGGY